MKRVFFQPCVGRLSAVLVVSIACTLPFMAQAARASRNDQAITGRKDDFSKEPGTKGFSTVRHVADSTTT